MLKIFKDISASELKRYGPYNWSPLKGKLASYFRISPENVTLGYGAEGIITQLFDKLVNQNSVVAIPEYCWRFYEDQIQRAGCKSVRIEMLKREKQFEHNLEEAIEKADVIILTNPNMPTGSPISIERILKTSKSLGTKSLLIDETYWGFETTKPTYEKQVADETESTVLIRSFSKLFGLAALRMGYSIMNQKMREILRFNDPFLGYNVINERVSIAALDDLPYYAEVAKKIEKQKAKIAPEFEKLGCDVFDSTANFIFCEVPDEVVNKLRNAFDRANIAVRFIHKNNKAFLRITIGNDAETKRVISALQKVKNG